MDTVCAGDGRQSGEDVPPAGVGAGQQAAHAPGAAQGAGAQVGAVAGYQRPIDGAGGVRKRPVGWAGAMACRCLTTTEHLKEFYATTNKPVPFSDAFNKQRV